MGKIEGTCSKRRKKMVDHETHDDGGVLLAQKNVIVQSNTGARVTRSKATDSRPSSVIPTNLDAPTVHYQNQLVCPDADLKPVCIAAAGIRKIKGTKGVGSLPPKLIAARSFIQKNDACSPDREKQLSEEFVDEKPLMEIRAAHVHQETPIHQTDMQLPLPMDLSEDHVAAISCRVKEEKTNCHSFNLTEVANDDDEDGVESSIDPTLVDVKGYRVRPETVPVLHQILEQQGDIAKDCKAVKALRGCLLEKVCYVYEKVQSSSFQEIKRGEILEMEETITGLEHMGLNLKWLSEKLDDILEAKVFLKVFAKKKEELKKANDQLATLRKTMAPIEQKQSVLEEEIMKMKAEEVTIQKVRNLLNNPLVD